MKIGISCLPAPARHATNMLYANYLNIFGSLWSLLCLGHYLDGLDAIPFYYENSAIFLGFDLDDVPAVDDASASIPKGIQSQNGSFTPGEAAT